MVTVATTQELKALDVLLRFKSEASQDDIHGSRSISARPVFGNCCYIWDSSHLYVVIFFFSFSCVCMCVMICAVFLLMFAILYKVTTHACW